MCLSSAKLIKSVLILFLLLLQPRAWALCFATQTLRLYGLDGSNRCRPHGGSLLNLKHFKKARATLVVQEKELLVVRCLQICWTSALPFGYKIAALWMLQMASQRG